QPPLGGERDRRSGSSLPFTLTGHGRARGRKHEGDPDSKENAMPRVQYRDIGETDVTERGHIAGYGDGDRKSQQRQLWEGQQTVLGEWHGHRDREGIAPSPHVPELRRVAVLEPNL